MHQLHTIVNDTQNENYQMWQNNYGPDSPKMYECYYFYNLTNADAVRCSLSLSLSLSLSRLCHDQ